MHICVEFEVHNTNISGVINMSQTEKKYGCQMKNVGNILHIIDVHMHNT